MPDILADLGPLFLGSRLKRLAERLQGDALKIIRAAGLAVQPAHMPLLAALDRYGPLTVGEAGEALGAAQPTVTRSLAGLIELGLVETSRAPSGDQRQKTIALTADGRAALDRAKPQIWGPVAGAVEALCAGLSGPLLDQIGQLETALADTSLEARVQAGPAAELRIRDYDDSLAGDFYRINEQWVSSMFTMEENDRRILEDPRGMIVDRGGVVCFVEAAGLGVVGTCALIRIEDGVFELTKMGVLESARGRKTGEFLLRHVIARAEAMGIAKLYLLTNRKCASAIHLYEKAGFLHDAEIMRDHGARYARCDVAMRYPLA
jgi:DNA-binding MarR family transcriptional regulator